MSDSANLKKKTVLVVDDSNLMRRLVSEIVDADPELRVIDVAENGKTSPRAAWSYLSPQPKMKPVDHWIGFWEDVEIK